MPARIRPLQSSLDPVRTQREPSLEGGSPYGNAAAQQDLALSDEPLPTSLLGEFERSLGADLSDVRLHADDEAAQRAGAVGARAFAEGDDVYFGEGEAWFDDPDGKQLLAHEVAHTVQQDGGPARIQKDEPGTAPSDAQEVEADQAAEDMVRQQPATVGEAPESGPPESETEEEEEDAFDDPAQTTAELDAEREAENAAPSFDGLAKLPPEEQAAKVAEMSDDDFQSLVSAVPEGDTEAMRAVIDNCDAPARKLRLWKEFHGTANSRELEAMLPEEEMGENPDAMAEWGRRNQTNGDADREVAEEVQALQDKGEDLTMDEVDAMIHRKEREHALEVKFNVNLTNDSPDSIAAMESGQPREARQWSEENLAWLEQELPTLPPEHVAAVTAFRRGSADYEKDKDGVWQKTSAAAQHHGDTGEVEVFDSGTRLPGSMVHEIGHNVDKNHPDERAKYDQAVGWKDFGDRSAVEAELAKSGKTPEQIKTELDKLDTATGEGGYHQKSVTIDGKVYEVASDKDGKKTYKAYNEDAIPGRDTSQATTDGWSDEWDYARTGGADLFAEHYKLAARDPVRLHQDMIDGPEKKVEDLEASGAPQADIDAAQKKVDTLRGQWDLMRGDVNGIDDQAVQEALPSDLSPEDAEAFQDQAGRCCTRYQLEQLAEAYANGDQVDDSYIGAMSMGLPADQQAAFEKDAEGCFSKDQLDKLRASYASGNRKDQKWKAGQSGDATMIGL